MTPEEIEIREKFGIKDEDILNIPAGAMWELCRQFKDALSGQSDVGDAVYDFYCKRVRDTAKQRAKVKRHNTNGRQPFDEKSSSSFKPGLQ